MNHQAGVKMGRLASGSQSDHGIVIHALPLDVRHYGHGKALCGTQPGRRSIGWATDYDINAINCPRCLRKLAAD